MEQYIIEDKTIKDDEYLRNNGFLGDDTKKIAEDLFGLNDYTGFMEKYFFD